jgi:hypothetical protein
MPWKFDQDGKFVKEWGLVRQIGTSSRDQGKAAR